MHRNPSTPSLRLLHLLPLGCAVSVPALGGALEEWGELKYRVGFNAYALFNVEVSLSGLGRVPAATLIGPASGRADRIYDDGYVRIDATGNQGGDTTYWGYNLAEQAVDGTAVVFSSRSVTGTHTIDGIKDEPHWGGELTFAREIGWNSAYWYGLVAAVSWTELRFEERATFSSDVVRVSDRYLLQDGLMPAAPYAGTAEGPGPTVAESPTRQTGLLPGQALTQGDYAVESSLYGLRLGLLFETPFSSWLTMQFGGGVAGAWVHGEFEFNEVTSMSGGAPRPVYGADSSDDFVGGAYAELGLSLRLSRSLSGQIYGRYLYLSDASYESGGRQVELNLESGIQAGIGLTFAF